MGAGANLWRIGMTLRASLVALLAAIAVALSAPAAQAFCGFYVAKADSKLYNKASKVVLAWDAGKTVITMASDYQGDPREFALVVPVPTFIERDQIGVVEPKLIDHLDAFTAPRLVEYFDDDPCHPVLRELMLSAGAAAVDQAASVRTRAKSLGVTVEATYTVGEYDIAILSAHESDGLVTFLTESGYRIPEGAADVLGSYIKQKMRFFVAKVNLGEQQRLGATFLRPLQVSYRSPKFMLPIRLGTVNAAGPQDMFVFALTRNGRVETSNYRTVKVPSDVAIPTYVKGSFAEFYKATFDRAVEREDMRVVFQEYAWDLSWCDPCAADPLSAEELTELGARWVADASSQSPGRHQVFATRLHVRYDRAHFPEDLMLMETRDNRTFQGRYILQHPFFGKLTCPDGETYRNNLRIRLTQEAAALAALTGWRYDDILAKIKAQSGPSGQEGEDPDSSWWRKMWE
jgi:hypothetical protein